MKQFEKVEVKRPKRSVFDLSHEKKLTMNMGDLVPCFLQEVIPGDTFHVNMEMLIRMQPLVAPVMHRINAFTHFFFVPNRLLYQDWQEFITGGVTGSNTTVLPKFVGTYGQFSASTDFRIGTLADYMGLPVVEIEQYAGVIEAFEGVSQLPFRAYQMIYNEYFRDQNQIEPIDILYATTDVTVNEARATELLTLRKRALEKDYFTSALPTAQRGNPVSMPLGEVIGTPTFGYTNGHVLPVNSADMFLVGTGGTDPGRVYLTGEYSDSLKVVSGLEVGATTITDLRTAYAIQRFLEKSMRGGARLVEYFLNVFGVKSSDARLQRPEYLGGGKMPLQIAEVLQTSTPTTAFPTPQANMAGHAITGGSIHGFTRTFEEHGFVIGIMSVLPRTAYQQGIPKLFSKTDRYDYLTPDFAHIGEQPVLNKEVYFSNNAVYNDGVFGYQPRYSEYRYQGDSVHGDFRTNLNYWHLGRTFAPEPVLNENFIECDAGEYARIYAVEDPNFQKLLVQLYANCKVVRPLPYFGTPMP